MITGAIVPTALPATAAPAGYLLCDGQAVSRTTYAALFAAIGATYGPGDGSSTFNVPDLRARTTAGVSPGSLGVGRESAIGLGSSGGAQTVKLTTAQLPSHSHNHSADGRSVLLWSGAVAGGRGDTAGTFDRISTTKTDQTGGDTAHENMPPWLGVTYWIKT